MKEEDNYLDMDISDAIIERTIGFSIGTRRYQLYSPSLGKQILIHRMVSCLGLNSNNISISPFMEVLRIAETNKADLCRILSYHTFNRKEDILDNSKIEYRSRVFERKLSNEEVSKLILLTLPDNVESFTKYLGLDKERLERDRISSFKKNKSYSVSFGGKSIYGTLIDYACQRYSWSLDYVVWGISYTNLRMLINDAVTTIELTKDEAKTLRISQGDVISGDDPRNIEKIKRLLGD